ncbi:hydroxypyruvate isomerase family protein [Sedimentitalea todarodis]|uniref:TIM barrel protein n=1 Tax=Sedimentitalea todarodis TaxID=1631240 RepID=A0ABU3VEC6_9RHOB|nr:TIM barrel protein [Sedimentitalea todarodis]MDU9004517.1 TIM barrel protein [Sedimentitalea todarodis]
MQLIANISMMFTEAALAARLEAARLAGFEGVEIQFPEVSDIASIRAASDATGVPVTLINVPRGPGDAVGLAALPGQADAYRVAVAVCAEQARMLGVCKVNVLAGRPPAAATHDACLATLHRNLKHTADVMAAIGVRVMVEPVNRGDVPGFFLSGLSEGLELLDSIDHPNLALQFDLYHMAITEPDLPAAIRRAGSRIGHVQFADTPGRNEPGTGTIDFAAAFAALRDIGYDGEVSAEYNPRRTTSDGLGWMAEFERMMT